MITQKLGRRRICPFQWRRPNLAYHIVSLQIDRPALEPNKFPSATRETTVPSPQEPRSPQQAHDRIVRRLKHLSAYRRRVKVIFGLLLLACALLAAGTLAVGAEAVLFLPAAGRQALLIVCALILAAVTAGFVLLPLIKGPSLERLAGLADGRYPRLRNGMVSALQLWRKRRDNPEGYSTELMEAAVTAAERRSRDLDLRTAVDPSANRRLLRLAGLLAGAAAVLVVIFYSPLRTSAVRLAHPRTSYQRPPQTRLAVSPGDIQVIRHTDVLVRARAEGRVPDQVIIDWKEGEARWRQEDCLHRDEWSFTHLFTDVKRDILYRVSGGDASSTEYRISVIDRPRVVKLRLRYDYPDYTGLEPKVVEEDGNISAVVGTGVELEVEANRTLDSAWLDFGEDRRQDLELLGSRAQGELKVVRSRTYSVGLRDELGNENEHPIRYRIEAVADEPPMVEIVFPAENVDMGEEMTLPLAFVAQDDYGLSRAELVHRTIRPGEEHEEQRMPVDLSSTDPTREEVEMIWDLTGLGLIPEDLVAYRVVVWDNDRVSGPKKTESRTYTVRFPSLHEILAQVQEEQSLQIADMENILEEERILKERLEQIRRELETEDAVTWEQKQDVEMTLERQEEMARELDRIAEEMDENIARAQERRVASMEIMEKMEQVQQLMEEVATPEMTKALEELRQAMQDLDPELIKQQMDQFSMTQEELLKRLDRTLSVLKRLQAEQQLDALIRKTEEMAQQQSDLMEQLDGLDQENLSDQEAMGDLARKQERLGQEAGSLPQEMEDLSALMEQFPEMPAEELSRMAREQQNAPVSEQMQQASRKMSEGQKTQARTSQEQSLSMLQQLQMDLQMLQTQMGGQMTAEVAEAIRGSVHDLLEISQQQEQHRSEVRMLDRESARFGSMAEGQLDLLEAVSRVADDLYAVAQKSFFISPQVGQAIGHAMAQMDKAMAALESRGASAAAHSEKAAMVALNDVAKHLINALQAMGSACSSGGMESMMQQLQGMSQSQMGINQQTLGLGQQGQMTMEQRAQMARLAAEQAAVQKQLSDLMKEFGNRSDILGRLDRVGDEMKKVVDDLARRQVDQQTIDRQQRILSRLLDAQKSVRRRDYSRQRRSRPGQVTVRRSPGELPSELEDVDEVLRRDLLQALSEDYPKAYQELIRAYFEALSREIRTGVEN
jgi:hypothetical protein